MGYVPPPPPPMGPPPPPDAGRMLRAGVARARRRWWHGIALRLQCWLSLGHRRVEFDIGGAWCDHCGARWTE